MTKEEMKNKISMALKDPILQQGFELICKNLADLEKENRLLGERCNQLLKDKGDLTDKVQELEPKLENIRYYLDNEIPHELINEATTIIYKMV